MNSYSSNELLVHEFKDFLQNQNEYITYWKKKLLFSDRWTWLRKDQAKRWAFACAILPWFLSRRQSRTVDHVPTLRSPWPASCRTSTATFRLRNWVTELQNDDIRVYRRVYLSSRIFRLQIFESQFHVVEVCLRGRLTELVGGVVRFFPMFTMQRWPRESRK